MSVVVVVDRRWWVWFCLDVSRNTFYVFENDWVFVFDELFVFHWSYINNCLVWEQYKFKGRCKTMNHCLAIKIKINSWGRVKIINCFFLQVNRIMRNMLLRKCRVGNWGRWKKLRGEGFKIILSILELIYKLVISCMRCIGGWGWGLWKMVVFNKNSKVVVL